MSTQDCICPTVSLTVLLSIGLFVGEQLFSSTEVLTFFAAFLMIFLPKPDGKLLSGTGCAFFLGTVVFIGLGAVMFPIYDRVWLAAGAGAIASLITFKTVGNIESLMDR